MKYLDRLRATGDEQKVFAGGRAPPKLTQPTNAPIPELTELTKPGCVSSASPLPHTKKSGGPVLNNVEVYAEKLKAATLTAVQEAARADVLAQLARNPAVQRAFVNRFQPDGAVIVTLAIRGVGTGELRIPAARFNQASLDDCAALLGCIEGAA